MVTEPEIDWSRHKAGEESNCDCSCETSYRSHTKFVMGVGLVARTPCPGCGSTLRLRASRSDWESF
jgi:hypothetical protein